MKLLAAVAIAGLGLRVAAPAAEAPPSPADDARTLTSSVSEVTVYADRARVVREATADLGPGVVKLAFRKLPGWLDEGSVRVNVTPADAAELLDVEVRKTYLARPDDAEIQQAEAAVQEQRDQVAALQDQQAVLEAQSRQLDSIRAYSLEKLPKDAVAREIKVDEYAAMVGSQRPARSSTSTTRWITRGTSRSAASH